MDHPTIKIEGKEYPFNMGRGALRSYCRKKGLEETKMKDINEILVEMDMNDQDLMNWYSFKVASSSEDMEFPYTFEEFQELLDDKPYLLDQIDEVSQEQMPDAEAGNLNMVKGKN